MRALRLAALALPFLAWLAAPAAAAPVDLALVLAIDVSESVDAERYHLQHEGVARAFEDKRLVAAIGAGAAKAIDVLVMEWSDRDKQVVTVDWTRVDDAASAAALAAEVRATRRSSDGLTAIGDALLAASAAFKRLPDEAARRVIDISGDGLANIGPPPKQVRDLIVAAGITINGLPILTEVPHLDQYYDQYVIGGPGAFLVTADSYESFATAIAKKLVSEIVGLPPRTRFAQGTPALPHGSRTGEGPSEAGPQMQ